MANAQVEKLKTLGLRHGEKVVVGLTALLCLFFLFKAGSMETIQLTADEVTKHAEAARANLTKRQEPQDILTVVEAKGVKNPGFVAQVDTQQKEGLKVDDYVVARPWAMPEPGAGLIRDTPELVAPTNLYAYPGRGGALVFELVDGKRVPEDPNAKKAADDAEKAKRRTRKKKRGRGNPNSEMMAGMGGAPGELDAAGKKKRDAENKRKAQRIAGDAPDEEKTAATATTPEGGPFKEVTRGLRWVAITGILDHKKMRDNYTTALKDPAAFNPNYKQLDVERQVLQADGTWSDWQMVDAEKNHEISFNIPEEDEELAPEKVLLPALVDPLPFLTAGFWERVHVARLVPKEKRDFTPPPGAGAGGVVMGSDGRPAMEMMVQQPMMMSAPMMPVMGAMGGPSNEPLNFPKSDASEVMIRALDYTVSPDTSYRYRLRVVVYNPNYNIENVTPGTDTKSIELFSKWSEPTNEVTMPDDITAYAMRKFPTGPGSKRNDMVQFQVMRWNPENGITTYRTMEYGPGQVVGDPRSTPIPASDGSGAKSIVVDYNSHQLLLDQTGGDQPLSQVNVGGKLEVPAISLLLRPDGSVMVRDQSFDQHDTIRQDMEDTYDNEIKESNEKRESSNSRKKKKR